MELADRRRQLGAALGSLEAGQWQQTEEACGRILAKDAVDVEALLLLGLSVAARGQTQRAAAILDRVARERPHDAHPCGDLPALLPRFSRTQIDAQYRACLRLAPEDLRLRQAFASFLQEGGEPEAAVALLREGLQLHPGSAVAQHAMGLALAELGHNEEAIWHFHQAVTTDPRQAASWANLGTAEGRAAVRPGDRRLWAGGRRGPVGRADPGEPHGGAAAGRPLGGGMAGV